MTVKIEERIGVPVPQERVWEVLFDLEGWKDWNPLHPKVEGKLAIGAPLRLEQRLPGKPAETIEGQVIDWVPYEQIHIGRSLARGWARSVRYLEIEPLTETSCIFSIGELFGGFLGASIAKRQRAALRAGFLAMGEALRDQVVKVSAPAPTEPVKAKSPAKPRAAKAKPEVGTDATPAAKKPAAKKVKLAPPKLQQYAPKPLGMKPPGMKPPGA